ncbi:helix-turn-helix domain-containing protein [Roseococcus pinisoli]|uniref:Transcriptional regulator n=1 Tax=Roseococcus pinisoli TaxID=2835040 RepID=A0ABS5QA09_9PROT|nr:hypothetical protein [Roseococcus pinisoli]MBS7810555.1 hypothetical protein [Roseococcus pinisoli]
MTQLLREAGEALYGGQWQSPLARDLGVTDRTMRRWVAGDSPVPDGAYGDLMRLTQQRALLLDDLTDKLRIAASPGGAPSRAATHPSDAEAD